MKHPSNLILAFFLMIVVVLGIYVVGRMALRIVETPVVEVEQE